MCKNFNDLKFLWLFIFIMVSCNIEPQPIKIGDSCAFCFMGVADNRFGAELITKKGKIYKFDDAHCLLAFIKANTVPIDEHKNILFVDFEAPHGFIDAADVFLLKSEKLRSPMGSNVAAYKSLIMLKQSQEKLGGVEVAWKSLASN